jgi:hypothetical protein
MADEQPQPPQQQHRADVTGLTAAAQCLLPRLSTAVVSHTLSKHCQMQGFAAIGHAARC